MTQKKAKYRIIYDALYNRLQEGFYPIGVRLPSEDNLASHFKVSRLTVRHALELLCQDGYLEVRQGSGYVVIAISPYKVNCLHSFTDNVMKHGYIPKTKIIDFFSPYRGDDTVYKHIFNEEVCLIRRLRLIDDIPWFVSDVYIPLALVSDIDVSDFSETGSEQSILSTLKNRFSLTWVKACEMISVAFASENIGALLDVPTDTPLIAQRCIAYDDNDKPVFCDYALRAKPINYDLMGSECILQEL